jgi:hypothetical protein
MLSCRNISVGIDGALCVTDVAAFSTAVVFWWVQEHVLHLHALHSKFDWMGKEIHEGHHANPYFHISIDPAGLMMSWLFTVHLIFCVILPPYHWPCRQQQGTQLLVSFTNGRTLSFIRRCSHSVDRRAPAITSLNIERRVAKIMLTMDIHVNVNVKNG